jgi:uncharacterized protein (TIRG00374 family)
MKARNVILVTVVVVLVYAGIALWGDVRHLAQLLAHFAWWSFAAALVLASTNYVLRFLKWQYYLARLDIRGVPVRESFVIFLSGFVMSITPAKAGEVFKSALLARTHGVPVARSAPIVVADRLTDLTSLILLVAVGGFYFRGGVVPAAVAAAMVGTILLFVLVRPLGEVALRLVGRLPAGARVAPKLREAYESLRLLAGPSALLVPTVLSLLAWSCECLGFWMVLRGLGAHVGVPVAFFVYATATIAGAVMMTPGGVGGTEGTMAALLVALVHGGLDHSTAAAATLLIRLATLWYAVLVGAVALWVFRRRYDRATPVTPAAIKPAV